MSLERIHVETGIPKPTLIRLLSVLIKEGLVQRESDSGLYSRGFAVLELAAGYEETLNIPKLSDRFLQELVQRTGLTVNIGVLQGQNVVHLAIRTSELLTSFRPTHSTGMMDRAYCTGIGKMLLSRCTDNEIDAHIPSHEPFNRYTDKTITSKSRLVEELAEIRKDGYSLDREEREYGMRCISVSIYSPGGVNAAVSISGPEYLLTDSDIIQKLNVLRDVTAKISKESDLAVAITHFCRNMKKDVA